MSSGSALFCETANGLELVSRGKTMLARLLDGTVLACSVLRLRLLLWGTTYNSYERVTGGKTHRQTWRTGPCKHTLDSTRHDSNLRRNQGVVGVARKSRWIADYSGDLHRRVSWQIYVLRGKVTGGLRIQNTKRKSMHNSDEICRENNGWCVNVPATIFCACGLRIMPECNSMACSSVTSGSSLPLASPSVNPGSCRPKPSTLRISHKKIPSVRYKIEIEKG